MMSIDYQSEVLERVGPYREVVRKAAPYLSEYEIIGAANVLMDLEEDPFNCVDYKSVAIAINEARG